MSLFPVNIQINPSDIITLDTLCDKTTYIHDLKRVIVDEQQLISVDNIGLKYKNTFMNDNNTLEYYGIYDSKHIIKLYFNVKDANRNSGNNYPPKKYSFISDDMNNNNNNNKYNKSAYKAPLLSKNKNQLIRSNFSCCNSTNICDSKRIFAIIPCCLLILFLVIFTTTTIALRLQFNIYREYSSQPNDCVLLDPICSNNCNEFTRTSTDEDGNTSLYDPGDDFNIGFVMNLVFIGCILVTFCCLPIFSEMDNGHLDCPCGWIFNCIGYLIFGAIFGIYVTLITYNSIISWRDLVRIRRYCDRDTHFYNGIMKWETWNIMNTFLIYTLPLLMCICGFSIDEFFGN